MNRHPDEASRRQRRELMKFAALNAGLLALPGGLREAMAQAAVGNFPDGVKGDTASGGVTKAARLETGLEIRVPLFIKEGEKVKVHSETREFAGRA